MSERRVLFSLGAIYGTSPELLRQIPELVKSEIEKLGQNPVRPLPLQDLWRVISGL